MSYAFLLENYRATEEELEDEFDSSYVPLMLGLQRLDNNKLIDSILKLDYSTRIQYSPKNDDIDGIVSKWDISKDLNVNLSDGEKNFNCICGKKHLYNLHLFFHENVEGRIIIGSKCVEKMKVLCVLCNEHIGLLNKIETIMEMFGFENRKAIYRRCWSCREHKIKRENNYSLSMNQYFCRGCLIVHREKVFLKCKCCRKKIEIEKCYYPNGRTRMESPYKLLCRCCWKETKEHNKRIERDSSSSFKLDFY